MRCLLNFVVLIHLTLTSRTVSIVCVFSVACLRAAVPNPVVVDTQHIPSPGLSGRPRSLRTEVALRCKGYRSSLVSLPSRIPLTQQGTAQVLLAFLEPRMVVHSIRVESGDAPEKRIPHVCGRTGRHETPPSPKLTLIK